MPDEKTQLLAMLAQAHNWCREAEARDSAGEPVNYDDETAVAWDLTGALCRLFGWQRARVLFEQFERHIFGKRPAAGWPPRNTWLDAMKVLQDFNDRPDMTYALIRETLEAMPVWNSGSRAEGAGNTAAQN